MIKQKILLVYIGNEQGSWGSTAFPKAAHYYVMPGILYCAKVLQQSALTKDRFEISYRFFNSAVQSQTEILSDILASDVDCIGFSVYCWNVSWSLSLIRNIKENSPSKLIVAGGPELCMKNSDECGLFFKNNPGLDMLVFGESESKLPELMVALFDNTPLSPHITGFAFSRDFGASGEFTKGYTLITDDIPTIYPFALEVKRSASCGIAVVYETGRGCPYKCIYCQFSHRNHKPYRYDVTRVERELEWLFEENFECIHFADAVFDLDISYAKTILNICKKHNRATSLFFYCSFYKMDEELAALFCESQAQICVGIQSTNKDVLSKINRALSPRLFHDIKDTLLKYPINFYVDLIFGLPHDTLKSFTKSLSDTLKLAPSFIMVFPLTLIKGTPLDTNADAYGIKVHSPQSINSLDLMCDIEYKNIALYKDFLIDDLIEFDDIALALFYFYSRFRLSLSYLEKRCGENNGSLYQRIGQKIKSFLKQRGIVATNTNFIEGFEDEIKSIFFFEAKRCGAMQRELLAFEEIFKLDIYRILMVSSPQREKLFKTGLKMRQAAVAKELLPETALMRIAPGKAVSIPFSFNDLLSLSTIKEEIQNKPDIVYVCSPFSRWDVLMMPLSPLQKFLLDTIPVDRPAKFKQILQSAKIGFYKASGIDPDENSIFQNVRMLASLDIISF